MPKPGPGRSQTKKPRPRSAGLWCVSRQSVRNVLHRPIGVGHGFLADARYDVVHAIRFAPSCPRVKSGLLRRKLGIISEMDHSVIPGRRASVLQHPDARPNAGDRQHEAASRVRGPPSHLAGAYNDSCTSHSRGIGAVSDAIGCSITLGRVKERLHGASRRWNVCNAPDS